MSIEINPEHKGLLHKHLGIPEGEKIPREKLEEVLTSDAPEEVKREAQFALNAEGFNHSRKHTWI